MLKPFLIVGRNSNLVRSVLPQLKKKYELTSHADIEKIDWSRYSKIFLFSWPKSDFDSFLKRIDCIPSQQLVFISTTAVLALQRRLQWASYPREKYRFEEYVLARGGSVFRIGVTEEKHANYLVGAFPFTSISRLAKAMDEIMENTEPVKDVFEIQLGKATGLCQLSSIFLNYLSILIPSVPHLQIIIHGVAKALGLKHYGYTSDANFFFRDTLQIGFGALGSCGPTLRPYNDLILTSPLSDVVINERGFLNTRLGFSTIGLARIWHGVELLAGPQAGLWQKHVPLWIKRSNPPKILHTSLHVDSLRAPISCGDWVVLGHNNHRHQIKFWCKKLVLAAGPITNARLLQGIVPISTTFSDHEIGMVGTAPLGKVVQLGLVSHQFLLMRPKYALNMRTTCGINFLIEARPNVPEKHLMNQSSETAFYLDSTASIIYKLIKKFNLRLINEAIFNKFGFALATMDCSIFVQVLVPNAIECKPGLPHEKVGLQRKRVTSLQWLSIQSEIAQRLSKFHPDSTVLSVDAQHILGGTSLMESQKITGAIRSGQLQILGSPTMATLDERHHTCRMQREIKATFKPLLLYLPIKFNESGCHDEHAEAIVQFADPWPVKIKTKFFAVFFEISRYRAVFFQKTALSNIPLALVCVCFGIPRILYLHEPLSISQHCQKGVPWFKAVLVFLFQILEVRLMTRILTGNLENKVFSERKLFYAPLLLPPLKNSKNDWQSRNKKILYFGRLDREKLFDEFQNLSLEKTVVATSNLNISNFEGSVSPVNYEEKRKYFETHRFVWCVQRNSLTQSGVLIDAIKFGCCCVVRKDDPIRSQLHDSNYIEIPINSNSDDVLLALSAYINKYPNGPIRGESFSRLCGQNVFEECWRANLL